MDKKDHPRGLCPEEREEWHKVMERLFELYEKMPLGGTSRKAIAGCCEINPDICFLMFKGTEDEVKYLRKILG